MKELRVRDLDMDSKDGIWSNPLFKQITLTLSSPVNRTQAKHSNVGRSLLGVTGYHCTWSWESLPGKASCEALGEGGRRWEKETGS